MQLWIPAAFAAYYIKGLCGFANTLVFTSILGFGADNVEISPVDLLLGYPSNLLLTWKNRRSLKLREALPLAGLVAAGMIPGALLLKNVDADLLKVIFGMIVVLLGLEMLLRGSGKLKTGESKGLQGVIGLLAGVMCGLFGVGALLAAYVGRTAKDSAEFKANICLVFTIENTIRIILYVVLHVFTTESLKQVLMMAPFMLLGLFLGMKSGRILDEKKIRKLVIFFLILSGVILIAKNI